MKNAYIPSTLRESSWTFNGCEKLDSITFGTGITTITEQLFQDCTGLTHIEIPGTVTAISDWAFFGCGNLKTISFGKHMAAIGYSSFTNCNTLSDVYYGGIQSQWNEIEIGYRNEPLTSANIHYNADIPDTPDTKPEPMPTPGPTDKPTPTPPVTPTPGPTSTPKFTDVKSGAYYYHPSAL